MDINLWVPNYYLLNPPKKYQNNFTYFQLRSDSNKRLFVYSLYDALLHYMNIIGYDVSRDSKGNEIIEEFQYYSLQERIKKENYSDHYIIFNRFYKRLQMYTIKNQVGVFKIVAARFFDNDPSKDYGFSIFASSKTVSLRVDTSIYTKNDECFDPCKFVHDFLIKISYPEHMYNYQLKNGYIRRLYYMYKQLATETGDYTNYNLPS